MKKFSKEADEVNTVTGSDQGYKRLRDFLRQSIGQPTIPYLGLILSDMMFIEEGNAWHKNGMINMKKVQMLFNIICTALQHQFVPYLYESVPSLQQIWESFALQDTDNLNEEYYSYSLKILPRGADKENENPFDNTESKQ